MRGLDMSLSRHQNAGQNHDVKIGNRWFENVGASTSRNPMASTVCTGITLIGFAPGGSSPTLVQTKTIKQHYTVVQHNTINMNIKQYVPNTIKYVLNIIKYNEAYSNDTNNTQYMQVFTFNPHLIHLFVTTFLTLFLKNV
jgi:hypothetical protein